MYLRDLVWPDVQFPRRSDCVTRRRRSAFDKNGNNYVCASSVRGTRTVVGDPNYAFNYFRVVDDKENAED